MSLLEEIQNAAVDSNSDLGSLLRKCKILAARLGSKPLDNWLLWESNGYPVDRDVPDYRIWSLELKGHFCGPFGSGMRNAPIPTMCIPKGVQDVYINYKCRLSIAAIEESLRIQDGGCLHVSTGDLAVVLGSTVYQNQNCVQAWAEFGTGHLIELLNSVRNRMLDFTLAVWKEAPSAGEQSRTINDRIAPTRITQIFNTTVYDGNANFVGNADTSTINFTVSQGDFTSLERALEDQGVIQDDINELKLALQDDGSVNSGKGFGPRVSTWIANMVKKSAEGTWKIGIGAAGGVLAHAISKYCGW